MQVVGRYALFDEIAHGGMATVHLGRLLGQGGFSRTVAIKRLHPHLARDPEFVTMLLDEARLVGRIQHPHVVQMLDVVATSGELMIVMEHVQGESLVRLVRMATQRGERIPPAIASAIGVNILRGLHAAHEVRGESGELLGLVHRDVTPHNIMVRKDGTALMLDFGVAKAAGRFHTTEEGKVKGKLPYMAPEQLRGQPVTRRTDIYAAGAVLWETLVGQRLFRGEHEGELLERVLFAEVVPPSREVPELPAALDTVVLRALERDPAERYATAADMADALESALPPALASHVASWLDERVGAAISRQAARVLELESGSHLTFEGLPDDVALMLAAGSGRAERGKHGGGSAAEAAGDVPVEDDAATRSGSLAVVPVGGARAPAPPRVPATADVASRAPEALEPGHGTTASVVSSVRAPKPPAGRTRWVVAGALGLLALLGWFAVRAMQATPPSQDAAAAATGPSATSGSPVSPSASASALTEPATSSGPSDGASSATPTGPSAPSESVSATGAASAVPVPKTAAAPPPPKAPTTSPAKPAPSDCVKIDAQGHRTYDRRCLQ